MPKFDASCNQSYSENIEFTILTSITEFSRLHDCEIFSGFLAKASLSTRSGVKRFHVEQSFVSLF